MSYNSQMNK